MRDVDAQMWKEKREQEHEKRKQKHGIEKMRHKQRGAFFRFNNTFIHFWLISMRLTNSGLLPLALIYWCVANVLNKNKRR